MMTNIKNVYAKWRQQIRNNDNRLLNSIKLWILFRFQFHTDQRSELETSNNKSPSRRRQSSRLELRIVTNQQSYKNATWQKNQPNLMYGAELIDIIESQVTINWMRKFITTNETIFTIGSLCNTIKSWFGFCIAFFFLHLIDLKKNIKNRSNKIDLNRKCNSKQNIYRMFKLLWKLKLIKKLETSHCSEVMAVVVNFEQKSSTNSWLKVKCVK